MIGLEQVQFFVLISNLNQQTLSKLLYDIYKIKMHPSGCRLLTEERCDTTGISRKNDSVKWNREEGDADIAAAKHRTSFGKIKLKSTRPVATVGLGIGMRSVVSAPDFSQLKLMHENVQKIAAANHLRDFPVRHKSSFFLDNNVCFFYPIPFICTFINYRISRSFLLSLLSSYLSNDSLVYIIHLLPT